MPHKFNAARRHKFPKNRYRLLEARMGKKGNREYVQVLRLLSFLTLAAVTGWVEIFQYACAGVAEHYNLGLRMSATGLE